MNDTVIKTENLTKDYGNGHGIFDISLEVKKGEIFGFIGTNGSGKTTTIRNMMGFIRPDNGSVSVLGMDSWKKSIEIKPFVSYVPGEIAFPKLSSGTDFLKLQADYLKIDNFDYMNKLIKMFQLDPSANLKRMSKGMKQKTALVATLMGDKDILVLDEPTTGLDPLMREVFLDLIREEKAKGKTVFMSSHIFEEIEEVCDRVAIIDNGKIVDIINVYALRHERNKHFTAVFENQEDLNKFTGECTFADCTTVKNECKIIVDISNIGKLIQLLKEYTLISLSEKHETLENRFNKMFYKGE